jgi:voltage-gated sodium channel
MTPGTHRVAVIFERVVLAAILLNTAILVASLLDAGHTEMLEHAESACLALFVVELAVRLRSHGWRRFVRSPWCVFDVLVIGIALLPVLGDYVTLLRVARLARVAHLLRHATHLQLFRPFRAKA